jgi:hypothetical protein
MFRGMKGPELRELALCKASAASSSRCRSRRGSAGAFSFLPRA